MTQGAKDAKAITQAALKAATMKDVTVRVSSSRAGHLRFGNNQAQTSGETERLEVAVTAAEGGRSATATGTRRDPKALAELVARAEALARLAPVDPEHMPPLGPQVYRESPAHDPKTAALDADARAEMVGKLLRPANKARLQAAGMVEHRDDSVALATRAGLFAFHAETEVSLSMTCRTGDGTGSGWASALAQRVDAVDVEAVAARATEKADLSRDPEAIAPGAYTVILEAAAVAELLSFLFAGLGLRAADEGRSYFARPGGGNRIGESLFHKSITLYSDPADRTHPSSPFGEDGLPLGPTTWIEGGVVKALPCGRYWAQKQGVPTVPGPDSWFLSGGSASLADLVRGVDQGILVTRLWYNRLLEPRTLLATGLTRDGTFRVERGKITRSLKNLRYNESPVTLLKNVLALGAPERVAMRGRVVVVPPMVVAGFNFASQSDAV